MPRYILTDPAADDVREIVRHLRQQSPPAAKRVRANLRAAMQKLAEFPLMGHVREDVTDQPLRFWAVYSYLIAYRPQSKPLQIVRVVHGTRDLRRFFQE